MTEAVNGGRQISKRNFPRGGGGDSHMEGTVMLVGNVEFNP